MWKAFVEGYKSVGAPDGTVVAFRVLGMIAKAAVFAFVVISVARCMGVPV